MREALELLSLEGEALFREAAASRRDRRSTFLVEVRVANACRLDPPCRNCQLPFRSRVDQDYLRRKSVAEVLEAAREAELAGARRLYLHAGWQGRRLPRDYCAYVEAVRADTGLSLYGFSSPVDLPSLVELKAAGLSAYFCVLVTANESLFRRLRPGDELAVRIQSLREARRIGLGTCSGMLFGIGESIQDRARALELFKELGVQGVCLFPFKPAPYTETETWDAANLYDWARMVAAAALFLDDADIFAPPEAAPWSVRAGANGFFPVPTGSASLTAEMAKLEEMRQAVYGHQNEH